VQDVELRVEGLRVWGSGFRVQGLRLWALGFGFKVQGTRDIAFTPLSLDPEP